MASLSRSPKTVQYGRRLFELLEEQQEPFLLDVYLSENGFLTGALKAEGRANCCPVNLCRRILKLCSHGWLKRRSSSRGCSNLRHVLGKLLHQKVLKKVLNWNGTANAGKGRHVLGVCGCFPEMGRSKSSLVEFQRLSKSGGIDDGESDGEVSWGAMEVGESKQLSPVSVLELHSDEASPIHGHYEDEKPSTSGSSPKKAFDAPWQGFEELLGSTSPTIMHQNAKKNKELDQSDQVMALLGCPMEVGECVSPQLAEKLIEDQLSSWEKMRVDFLRIPNLIGSDISKSTKEWSQFHPEMTKIGKEIENLIFEEIRRESVLDLLGSHCTLIGDMLDSK
ncbi:hypothetical protein ACMD2_08176 [Ananas comosus]|uniref:DUF4378 domain-containing protein n=1 Tax=Ananas comosus TaxID=4615 RepID=A0A199VP92_ANACO|nr:hypothetical protein ACMD2_08176 [Ananas comosus]